MHVCIVLVLDTYRIEKRVVGSRERMSSKSCFGFEAFFFFYERYILVLGAQKSLGNLPNAPPRPLSPVGAV